MSKDTYQHLEALRQVMASKNVDAVIIPGTDPHQSEYISDHWKFRDWLTGFNGSNGTAVVTATEAGLWTDSRYFLQAQEQLEGSGFTLHKEHIPGEATIQEWLAQQLGDDSIVAIDGRLFSMVEANRLEVFCGNNGFMLATDFYPADAIWPDRPARPSAPAFVHQEQWAGESVDSKIERTLTEVKAAGADCMLVTALDDIAWLLNLRGSDIDFTPVVVSFCYISAHDRVLFIDEDKVTKEVKQHLKDCDVKIKDYDDITKYLTKVSEHRTILLDPNAVSDTLGQSLLCQRLYAPSPIAELKALKNEVEIAGERAAMEHDGVAFTRMMMWLEQAVPAGGVTEIDVWNKLMEERKKFSTYHEDSFHMIVGYKEHGAIVHYEPTPESASTLAPEGLLLMDTGGQYLEGTTDMTRTITLGNPTEQEKHDFTLVLKGHLDLARAVFPVGTMGVQLDALARMPLWQEGMTYLHGTGHGVGHFLCCHEGPQSIRMESNPTSLKLGMITSNEPGLYKAGEYGIRTENLLLTVPATKNDDFGEFYKFETLTLFPYDVRLIDKSMLTREEIEQLNAYHQQVLDRLLPLLEPQEQEWLKSKAVQI